MSCKSRICLTTAIPLCLLLAACGGGGGAQVASIPPPPVTPSPTPTPTPAVTLDIRTSWLDAMGTHEGTYGLMGRLTLTPDGGVSSSRFLAASEGTMTTAKQNGIFNYALNVPGIVPTGAAYASPEISWSANNDPVYPQIFEDDQNGKLHQYLGPRLTAYRKAPDGSEEEYMSYDFRRGTAVYGASSFTYDVGFSYVAMGEWASSSVVPGAFPVAELLFVYGERTPAAGIPVSGTATYDAHMLSLLAPVWDSAEPGLPFTMTADFGARTISTVIDQNYQHYPDQMGYGEMAIRGGAILGIHVSGSAPFSNDGIFDIPLTGTANYSATNALNTPPSEPVTGTMDGAFFGPNAENVGGTFGLNRADGTLMVQDAFVGQQHH